MKCTVTTKAPCFLGGTDEYKNLVLIEEDIHRLVHLTKDETIMGICHKKLVYQPKNLKELIG